MSTKTHPSAASDGNLYDADIIAWSHQQAGLLRASRFSELDIERIAEEIEDVGKSEQRELASRMAVLLAHLLKWQYQPERRSNSWRNTLRAQRGAIAVRIKRTPSLKAILRNEDWWEEIWADAISAATAETGLGNFPASCPWQVTDVLNPEWMP